MNFENRKHDIESLKKIQEVRDYRLSGDWHLNLGILKNIGEEINPEFSAILVGLNRILQFVSRAKVYRNLCSLHVWTWLKQNRDSVRNHRKSLYFRTKWANLFLFHWTISLVLFIFAKLNSLEFSIKFFITIPPRNWLLMLKGLPKSRSLLLLYSTKCEIQKKLQFLKETR